VIGAADASQGARSVDLAANGAVPGETVAPATSRGVALKKAQRHRDADRVGIALVLSQPPREAGLLSSENYE
jgi:hypothetical protein